MTDALEKLAVLRRFLPQRAADDRPRVPLGHGPADAAMGGLALGALHEVYAGAPGDAAAATGFAAALATRANVRAGWLFWIRQDYSALEHGEIHAAGLCELGIDPSRVLMLKVADVTDALKAAGDVLACRGIGAVIVETISESKLLDLTASRRLTLAANEKCVTAIVLRQGANPQPSAAETRWIVHAGISPPIDEWGAPVFDVELARNRHGTVGQWAMEWRCDERSFREPEWKAHRRAVPAPAFHRPDRTPAWHHAG